jgi:RNA polymerase sigma-70 factor (ECF subfamily)
MTAPPRVTDRPTPEALVCRAQAGDAVALEQLLGDWRPRLVQFAAGFLRNPESAQDVVQETLVKLAANLRHLAAPAAFPAWAMTILRRECIEFYRRERRRQAERLGFDELPLGMLEADQTAEFAPSLEMAQCLGRLRREDRELLGLHYWCGLELREIAQRFGIAAGAVKTRLFRAREQLRGVLVLKEESHAGA